MVNVIRDCIGICEDCAVWVANADSSGMDDETFARVTDIDLDAAGIWVLDTSHDDGEFSLSPCGRCGSGLGGMRYGAAILGR